ncbi:hypothetical protein FCV25MIE_01493 [Fagus crenata]
MALVYLGQHQRVFFNFGASTTAVSTSAATTSTVSAGLSLVDGDITAVQAVTIHSFDRIPHRLLVAEGNESRNKKQRDLKGECGRRRRDRLFFVC